MKIKQQTSMTGNNFQETCIFWKFVKTRGRRTSWLDESYGTEGRKETTLVRSWWHFLTLTWTSLPLLSMKGKEKLVISWKSVLKKAYPPGNAQADPKTSMMIWLRCALVLLLIDLSCRSCFILQTLAALITPCTPYQYQNPESLSHHQVAKQLMFEWITRNLNGFNEFE